MTCVVSTFTITVLGTTRDEVVTKMDRLGIELLDLMGGAPWLEMDDDTVKVLASQVAPVLADDQGFMYTGKRTYNFRGPLKSDLSQNLGMGNELQKGSE